MIPGKRASRGRPRAAPTKVQNVTVGAERVGVRMEVTLLEQLQATAKREGCSVSELMRACAEVLVEHKCNAMLPHVREVLKR